MSLPGAPNAHTQHLCGHTAFAGAIQVLCGDTSQQQTWSGAMVCAGRRCPVGLAQCWRTDASPALCFLAGILSAGTATFLSGTLFPRSPLQQGKTSPSAMSAKTGSRSRGDALMGKPMILKTLIHVMPAFGCAGWRVPLWDCPLTTSDQK